MFGSPHHSINSQRFTSSDRRLSLATMIYFSTFIRTGWEPPQPNLTDSCYLTVSERTLFFAVFQQGSKPISPVGGVSFAPMATRHIFKHFTHLPWAQSHPPAQPGSESDILFFLEPASKQTDQQQQWVPSCTTPPGLNQNHDPWHHTSTVTALLVVTLSPRILLFFPRWVGGGSCSAVNDSWASTGYALQPITDWHRCLQLKTRFHFCLFPNW